MARYRPERTNHLLGSCWDCRYLVTKTETLVVLGTGQEVSSDAPMCCRYPGHLPLPQPTKEGWLGCGEWISE